MFENENGARLAVKRVQDAFGLRSSSARELVARAGGWSDWHHLEKTVGTVNAPAGPSDGTEASAYAKRRSIEIDVDALLAIAAPKVKAATPGTMTLITPGAARILTALHCGCDATLSRDRDREWSCRIRTHTIAPYTHSRMVKSGWVDDPHERAAMERRYETVTEMRRFEEGSLPYDAKWSGFDSPPPTWRPGIFDRDGSTRLDNWGGEPGRVDFADAVVLVRAGLAENSGAFTGLTLTERGHAVAQAMVGDGVRIVKERGEEVGRPHPISYVPDSTVGVGRPASFTDKASQPCRQGVSLRPWNDKILIEPEAIGRHVRFTGEMSKSAARAFAAFLGDASRATRRCSTRFSDVEVAITGQDGGASLRFHDEIEEVEVTFGRAHVRLLRAYLVEIAKGADETVELDGLDVRWSSTWAVAPETLAA